MGDIIQFSKAASIGNPMDAEEPGTRQIKELYSVLAEMAAMMSLQRTQAERPTCSESQPGPPVVRWDRTGISVRWRILAGRGRAHLWQDLSWAELDRFAEIVRRLKAAGDQCQKHYSPETIRWKLIELEVQQEEQRRLLD